MDYETAIKKLNKAGFEQVGNYSVRDGYLFECESSEDLISFTGRERDCANPLGRIYIFHKKYIDSSGVFVDGKTYVCPREQCTSITQAIKHATAA